jgi:23S rRNA (pseudouridine1915-N3)-methyltransferase
MRIVLLTVGRDNEPYVDHGIKDFTKRINNYFTATWKIIPLPKNAASLTEDELKKKEGESILKILEPNDYLVALDEKGKPFTSLQLASFLQQRANESSRQLVFLIGGAYGIDAMALHRANHVWSLSSLTFPHQLVRLILAEQLYRACTILRNEKYHHS